MGMAVACNRYKFVAASLPKRLRNDRFSSETAARNGSETAYCHLDLEVV
jgi:hypothetical protein